MRSDTLYDPARCTAILDRRAESARAFHPGTKALIVEDHAAPASDSNQTDWLETIFTGARLKHRAVAHRLNAGTVMANAFTDADINVSGAATVVAKKSLEKSEGLDEWVALTASLKPRSSCEPFNIDEQKEASQRSIK